MSSNNKNFNKDNFFTKNILKFSSLKTTQIVSILYDPNCLGSYPCKHKNVIVVHLDGKTEHYDLLNGIEIAFLYCLNNIKLPQEFEQYEMKIFSVYIDTFYFESFPCEHYVHVELGFKNETTKKINLSLMYGNQIATMLKKLKKPVNSHFKEYLKFE
jgi:hypothetical protein